MVCWTCVSMIMPKFKLSVKLFAKERRGQLMPLLRVVADVPVLQKLPVSLSDMSEVTRLAKILSSIGQSASTHLAGGGAMAAMVITQLRFDAQTIDRAFNGSAATSGQDTTDDQICLGAGPVLKVACCESLGLRSVRLHLALRGGALLAFARTDCATPAQHLPLTVDLVSLSSEVTLSFRGVDVCANQGWQPMSGGIIAPSRGKAAARAALAEGVPCVVCLRDGISGHKSHVAMALHLDNPNRRSR